MVYVSGTTFVLILVVALRAEAIGGTMLIDGGTQFSYSATNNSYPIEKYEIGNIHHIGYNNRGEFIIEEDGRYVIEATVDVKFINATITTFADILRDFMEFTLTINGTTPKRVGKSEFTTRIPKPPDTTVKWDVFFHALMNAHYGDRIGMHLCYENHLTSFAYSAEINVELIEGEFSVFLV